MNREEIEALCNTNEIEFVDCSTAITNGMNNKCGNMTRGTRSYPDIIELLLAEENKANHWQLRDSAHNMLSRSFPAFGDVYFILTSNYSRRTDEGAHQSVETGYGMYYSRNNYTIEEDDNYFYITSNYDLYINTGVTSSNRGMQNTFMRADRPRFLAEDTRGIRLMESIDNERGRSRHRRNPQNSYPWTRNNRTRVRTYIIENILPGIRSHATNAARADILRISNALNVCTAIDKEVTLDDAGTFVPDEISGENPRCNYAWTERSRAQSCIQSTGFQFPSETQGTRITCRYSQQGNYRNQGTVDELQNTNLVKVDAITDGANHKKHDYLFMRISYRNRVLFGQTICSKEIHGDLQQITSRKILPNSGTAEVEANPLSGMTLQRKVLLSEKAESDYYSPVDIEDRVDLADLINTTELIRLIRTGDTDDSKKGDRLSDLCQFSDGVYEAIVDRPMHLRRGNVKISIRPGRYVVTVDSIVHTDFLWYTRITAEHLSGIAIEEISGRLTLNKSDDDDPSRSSNRVKRSSRAIEITAMVKPTIPRDSSRIRRNRLSLSDIQEDDTVVVDDEERETLE